MPQWPCRFECGATMNELCSIDYLEEKVPSETRVVRTIKHGDTTYELYVGACGCCGTHPVFRLMRLFGSSLSIYELSAEDCRNLDEYVANLHESFSIDVVAKLTQLRATIEEFNSKGFFETEGVHPSNVRLIDKARLIANRLSKQGKLQEIIDHADDSQHDLASAFILGCIATENHWLTVHEDAVFEGYAHIEGRESGRPLALAARIRQGKRTRSAVIDAVAKLYAQDPSLQRNDTKTANRMVSLKLDSLKKRDGTYLGSDAIVKHLRAARLNGGLTGKS
jgi:hypothetical protein